MREVIPFHARPIDYLFVGFFALNFGYITYLFDIEQLVIADPNNFDYPWWPPPPFVDIVHWWGRNYDPVLIARPAFWRAAIWIDVLFFGPYYAAALYAFVKGKDWIRIPSIIWASVMLTNVTIIMFEEFFGVHATPAPVRMVLANFLWVVVPIALIARMWRPQFPFTR